MTRAIDPIMSRFHAALYDAYGPRLERVVLFGSRARGDARPDSDYDVAVVLSSLESIGQEAEISGYGARLGAVADVSMGPTRTTQSRMRRTLSIA
jgi:predicted nucleotidyltransferase